MADNHVTSREVTEDLTRAADALESMQSVEVPHGSPNIPPPMFRAGGPMYARRTFDPAIAYFFLGTGSSNSTMILP